MQPLPDYRRFTILYVDDEEKSLKLFSRAFGETFKILTAPTAKEGLALLEANKDEVAILMTDQRMPGEKGVWLLERARQLQPRLLRILVTAYADMEAAISAVNSGSIYRYVNKPWDPVQLEETLKRGLEFFIVQRERDQLLEERVTVLHNMTLADRILSVGVLAAGLGHHIRNALVAVKTFLDLAPAQMQAEKTEPARIKNPEFWNDYYNNVQGQIQKINRLLNYLSVAAEQTSAQFVDQLNLRDVINSVVEKLKEPLKNQKIEVVNEVPAALPALQVDATKFPLIFEYLLQDEIVSLPVGSQLKIRAIGSPEDSPREVEVEINDNGPGLPEEALQRLFNPFMARSDSPAEFGLNLMASYFILHHHGGRIEASSKPGVGTTFRLRLPIKPAERLRTEEPPEFLRKALFNTQSWQKLASQ